MCVLAMLLSVLYTTGYVLSMLLRMLSSYLMYSLSMLSSCVLAMLSSTQEQYMLCVQHRIRTH